MARPVCYPLLVVDAGNTSVKFALVTSEGSEPKPMRPVPTPKLTVAAARRAGARARSVVVASVVPSASRVLRRAFPRAQFIGSRTRTAFTTLVDRRTIGTDRLANVAAAHARFGRNVLVASFGTAATFDVIDADGIHRGGAIAPGWQSFAAILPARTALLPRTAAEKAKRFSGRNTREALRAGVAGGYAAMVGQLIARMKSEARIEKLRVICTGGDAAVVGALFPRKPVSDPLLTLRGTALLAQGAVREGRK